MKRAGCGGLSRESEAGFRGTSARFIGVSANGEKWLIIGGALKPDPAREGGDSEEDHQFGNAGPNVGARLVSR